jgi:hypothetical protein
VSNGFSSDVFTILHAYVIFYLSDLGLREGGKMKAFRFSCAGMLTFVVLMPVRAVADCDAEFAQSLRSYYSLSQNNTVKESLFQLACSSQKKSSQTGVGIGIYYVNLAYNNSENSTVNACMKKDYSFFENNKVDIVYSFLPDAAFQTLSDACAGGLAVKINLTGNQINLRTTYRPGRNGKPATLLSDLEISPKDAVRCSPLSYRKGLRFIPAGRDQNCKRLSNTDITFTLRTDEAGDKSVILARSPTIEYTAYDWTYNLSSDSAQYQCRNQTGIVGNFVPGSAIGGTGGAAVARLIGSCVEKYGTGYYKIDGKAQSALKPVWSFRNAPNASDITCAANGNDFPAVSCLAQGICSQPGDDAGLVTTRTRYWCAGTNYKSLQAQQ